jgi:hypothetical protein
MKEIVFYDAAGNETGRLLRGQLTRDLAKQADRDGELMKAFKAKHPETVSAKIFTPSGAVMTEYAEETQGGEWVNKAWLKK